MRVAAQQAQQEAPCGNIAVGSQLVHRCRPNSSLEPSTIFKPLSARLTPVRDPHSASTEPPVAKPLGALRQIVPQAESNPCCALLDAAWAAISWLARMHNWAVDLMHASNCCRQCCSQHSSTRRCRQDGRELSAVGRRWLSENARAPQLSSAACA